MKTRRIVTIILFIFVATSIVYLVATELWKPEKHETASAGESRVSDTGNLNSAVSTENHALTVYYFHTTFRCPTCRKIEALTESTVKTFFSGELADEKLIWSPVNIELPENRHFVDDFKLFTKSVVLVDSAKGKLVRWKNLGKIWELVRDEPAFTGYIKNEISDYLKDI